MMMNQTEPVFYLNCMPNHKMTWLNHGHKSHKAKLVTLYFDNEIIPKVKGKGGGKKEIKIFVSHHPK